MTIHKFETGTARNVTATTLISLMRYTGLIENLDTLIPEVPESPYSNLYGKQRVRHNGNKKLKAKMCDKMNEGMIASYKKILEEV